MCQSDWEMMAMVNAEEPVRVLQADRLIDGRGGPPKRNMAVVIAGNRIKEIVPKAELAASSSPNWATEEFPGATLLPGLIDCHSHTNMPADGRSGEEVIPDGDDIRLLRSARNVRAALESGVTTLCDCGAWNKTAFSLKKGVEQGLVEGPSPAGVRAPHDHHRRALLVHGWGGRRG